MNLHSTLITALALSTPPAGAASPALPPTTTATPAAPTTPVPALDGEINGTRQDLADFLRRHRRALRLRFFDRWGDPEFPIHSFVSLLQQAPFRESNGSRSCAMHFTIFPF